MNRQRAWQRVSRERFALEDLLLEGNHIKEQRKVDLQHRFTSTVLILIYYCVFVLCKDKTAAMFWLNIAAVLTATVPDTCYSNLCLSKSPVLLYSCSGYSKTTVYLVIFIL